MANNNDIGNFKYWLESLSEDVLRRYLCDMFWKDQMQEGAGESPDIIRHFNAEHSYGIRVADDANPIVQWPHPGFGG